jgi:hypothetical protein
VLKASGEYQRNQSPTKSLQTFKMDKKSTDFIQSCLLHAPPGEYEQVLGGILSYTLPLKPFFLDLLTWLFHPHSRFESDCKQRSAHTRDCIECDKRIHFGQPANHPTPGLERECTPTFTPLSMLTMSKDYFEFFQLLRRRKI